MHIFGTVSQLSTETPPLAVRGALCTQGVVRFYLDQFATASRGYLAAWIAAQQAGLRTTFDLQNSTLQALQTLMLDAPLPGDHAPLVPPAGATLPLSPVPPAAELLAPTVAEQAISDNGCVASALNFPPPLGIIFADYQEEADGGH